MLYSLADCTIRALTDEDKIGEYNKLQVVQANEQEKTHE
jgi:hypothetical protein